MNEPIYIIFFFVFLVPSEAQNISIEFSIEWKEKLDFQFKELEKENISPACLNIIYHNISSKAMYCLKITDNHFGLPQVSSYIPHAAYPLKRLPYYNYGYYRRRYFVGFQSDTGFLMRYTWNVRNDTSDVEYQIIKETLKRPVVDVAGPDGSGLGRVIGDINKPLYDGIGMSLDAIYNYIYCRYYPETKEKIFYSSDITRDTIMNSSAEKFVFLKPGETYVDKFNLIGFQIIGGSFTFQLDNTKSLDYVVKTEPVKKIDGSYETQHSTKKLPKKVGEYELFTGEFLTNKVSVQLPPLKVRF